MIPFERRTILCTKTMKTIHRIQTPLKTTTATMNIIIPPARPSIRPPHLHLKTIKRKAGAAKKQSLSSALVWCLA